MEADKQSNVERGRGYARTEAKCRTQRKYRQLIEGTSSVAAQKLEHGSVIIR